MTHRVGVYLMVVFPEMTLKAALKIKLSLYFKTAVGENTVCASLCMR